MKGIDTGKDKVKKICDILKRETLEPAIDEAEKLIADARARAEEMISAAKIEAKEMIQEANRTIERERNVFQSSLGQACKQAIESLKQNIESRLFDRELGRLITAQMQDAHLLAELITSVVKGVEKEGLEVSLSAYIPANIPPRAVNELLAHKILDRLKEKSVLVGAQSGGIQVVLHQDKLTIDLSDQALKELVASYIRKDFRTLIFGS